MAWFKSMTNTYVRESRVKKDEDDFVAQVTKLKST